MKVNTFWTLLKKSFFLQDGSEEESPNRYVALRNRIVFLMLLVTLLPLSIMAIINHHEYKRNIKDEIVNPMQTIVNKTTHSFELYLEERLSIVRFIASSYSLEDLSDEKTLNRIFRTLINEYLGFVDLGLIDDKGNQVSYVGPYSLSGKNYSKQAWFQELVVRGSYVSDVFMGYRELPHIALAVQRRSEEGYTWSLRATLDTKNFDNLIAAMELGPESDAFLINREGVLQTPSRFYGKILHRCPLDRCPVSVSGGSYASQIIDAVDPKGQEILMAYAPFFKYD